MQQAFREIGRRGANFGLQRTQGVFTLVPDRRLDLVLATLDRRLAVGDQSFALDFGGVTSFLEHLLPLSLYLRQLRLELFLYRQGIGARGLGFGSHAISIRSTFVDGRAERTIEQTVQDVGQHHEVDDFEQKRPNVECHKAYCEIRLANGFANKRIKAITRQ